MVSIVKHLINDSLDIILKDLFTRLVKFYELGNINEASFTSKQNDQGSLFQRIDLFCEEISNISNQNENFYKHLIASFNDFKTENPEEKLDFKQISYKLQGVALTNRVTELLGKFIFYEQLYLVIDYYLFLK